MGNWINKFLLLLRSGIVVIILLLHCCRPLRIFNQIHFTNSWILPYLCICKYCLLLFSYVYLLYLTWNAIFHLLINKITNCYCFVTRMLSPSSFLHNTPTHQVGVTPASHYKLQKRNFNSTSFSSCPSSSCSMINQQVNRSISCRASMETDVSQRL